MSLLDGTMPVRPCHPDGFVGTMQADGQSVRVAALACEGNALVVLSVVGFDTSVGAVLAGLWSLKEVSFTPTAVWRDAWSGPDMLRRGAEHYKQAVAHLEGTREVHALALVRTAHLAEGMLHPPDLPAPEPETKKSEGVENTPAAASAVPGHTTKASPPQPPAPPKWMPRYVSGNWNEVGPCCSSFLGHLYALRVPVLQRHVTHPAWREQWAEALWERGLAHELITPLSALGLRAWKLSGDVFAWSELVGSGVREGWLPWRETP